MLKVKNHMQADALRDILKHESAPMEIATKSLDGTIVVSLPKANRVMFIGSDGNVSG